jgi:hypothetical protein
MKGVSVVEKLMDNFEHPAKSFESLNFPFRTEDHGFCFGFSYEDNLKNEFLTTK